MKPRLLLVEDDPVSRSFMLASLESLPAEVEVATSCAEAMQLPAHFDLWLLDANLPDGTGTDLLWRLRERHVSTPAMAHTADNSPNLRTRLLADGFAEVLLKPISANALLNAVRPYLNLVAASVREPIEVPETTIVPLWNDEAARTALNGNDAHVHTLRQLFLSELPCQYANICTWLQTGDIERAWQALHQLRSSSGFVGAARLHTVVRWLQDNIDDEIRRDEFSRTVRETLSDHYTG